MKVECGMGEVKELYSVKMRSSLGSIHGKGGRHISGAERIIGEEQVEAEVISMLRRAREHDRGAADYIQLKVERVRPEEIIYCPMLPLYQMDTKTKDEGRLTAKRELVRAGVGEAAVEKGFALLESLADSMRGAAVIDATTGTRLDGFGMRGVRCSSMDCEDSKAYERQMGNKGLSGDHPREALILASKVAAAPGTVAELCWSDDPFYVTGYVASPKLGYGRITVMKDKGDPIGGRVFFVKTGTDMESYMAYMQEQAVLVRVKI